MREAWKEGIESDQCGIFWVLMAAVLSGVRWPMSHRFRFAVQQCGKSAAKPDGVGDRVRRRGKSGAFSIKQKPRQRT